MILAVVFRKRQQIYFFHFTQISYIYLNGYCEIDRRNR